MDNTEKSVILQKVVNTIPPFRRFRSSNFIRQILKKLKFNLTILAAILTLTVIVLFVNAVESNAAIGFEPAGSIANRYKGDNYYTTAYNNVFAEYKETFDVTVNIVNENSRELNVPMLTVSEIVSNYFSPVYSTDEYEINLPHGTVVGEGLKIFVNKLDWKEHVVDVEVEFETIYVDVQTIPKGEEVIVRTGENAQVTRTVRDKYLNGKYDSSIIKNEIVKKPVVDEIIYRGIGGQFTTPRGVTYGYSYYIDVTATAYGVDTGYGGSSEYTYTGKVAEIGVIAVDPEVIPLGSKVYVTSDYMDHGVCYAEDIGSGIIGYRIDVHLGDDLESQLAFGSRNARVYVLE